MGLALLITEAVVEEVKELEHHIFLLKMNSRDIARIAKPGQFLNIRVSESDFPLLRRPFSICDVEEDSIFIMFNIYGEGTRLLAHKISGDKVDIIGPLGNGFNLVGDYETAVVVAGGLGAAPFPFMEKVIRNTKNVVSFVGGRTYKEVITYGLSNLQCATDDGSLGFKGNVVDLFKSNFAQYDKKSIKVFACGPSVMLRALQEFALMENIECEVSTECVMACGFGICQGCPIKSRIDDEKYLLVCKDGPVFNVKDVVI